MKNVKGTLTIYAETLSPNRGLPIVFQISSAHLRDVGPLGRRVTQFYELRETPGLKKKPSTSEVLDWLKLLMNEDLSAADLKADANDALPRLHGALLKNEQDVHMLERIAFMNRRQQGR